MIDIINSQIIKYNPNSFRQPDNAIKETIYNILKENVNNKNLYLIGGEMIFFDKLLNSINLQNIIMYTDFLSIYQDALINININYNINYNINLINYENDKLQNPPNDNYTLIINTSKQGLGYNLSNQISKMNFNQIIIISCNKKSFNKDFNILHNFYKLLKTYDITTNYSVTLYFLIKTDI